LRLGNLLEQDLGAALLLAIALDVIGDAVLDKIVAQDNDDFIFLGEVFSQSQGFGDSGWGNRSSVYHRLAEDACW